MVIGPDLAKWRLRIKLAEQIHKKPQPETLAQLERAGEVFKAGDYESAVNMYSEIYNTCNDYKALSNRSACWLKLNNPKECINDCTLCLSQIDTETEILRVEIGVFVTDEG
jgi:predicted DNA-binding helix-hairpin-helix protein